jgi:hypothetical protein
VPKALKNARSRLLESYASSLTGLEDAVISILRSILRAQLLLRAIPFSQRLNGQLLGLDWREVCWTLQSPFIPRSSFSRLTVFHCSPSIYCGPALLETPCNPRQGPRPVTGPSPIVPGRCGIMGRADLAMGARGSPEPFQNLYSKKKRAASAQETPWCDILLAARAPPQGYPSRSARINQSTWT